MKDWKVLAIIFMGVIGALWISGRLNEQRSAAPYTMTRKRRRRYRLTPSSALALRCRYTPHPHLVQINPRMQVSTIINERMLMLQADPTGLDELLERGRFNGWSEYKTIYWEAVQTLLSDGTIQQASDDLCIEDDDDDDDEPISQTDTSEPTGQP